MALTPQNEEAFFREVDEELRREQIGTFWRRYGRILVVAVVAALAAFGGWLWWQSEQEKAAGAASETMIGALDALGKGQDAEATRDLQALSAGKSAGYSAVSRLALAAQKVEKGDARAAAAAYSAIVRDQSVAQPFRDLALVRQTAVEFDSLTPQAVIDRLRPLAAAGNPWFGSAGEMTAMAWLKMGQKDKAGALFAQIAKDKDVPDTIRGRAVRIAGALGIDAAADAAAPGKEVSK